MIPFLLRHFNTDTPAINFGTEISTVYPIYMLRNLLAICFIIYEPLNMGFV